MAWRNALYGLLGACMISGAAQAAPGDWVRRVVPITAPADIHALPLGAPQSGPLTLDLAPGLRASISRFSSHSGEEGGLVVRLRQRRIDQQAVAIDQERGFHLRQAADPRL